MSPVPVEAEIPMADRLAVRALAEVYAAAVDHRDAELFASIWTPGATQRISWSDGSDDTVLRQPDQRAAVIGGLGRYERTLHLVANQRCLPAADGIRGEVYCEAHHVTTATAGEGVLDDRVLYIRYEDDYRREAGGWRIARRHVHVLWMEDRRVRAPARP